MNSDRPLNPAGPAAGSTRADTLALFGLLIVLALVLGIPAFRHAPQVPGQIEVPYQHSGAFLYAADGVPSVYENGTAHTGEPIFFRVSNNVQVGFQYDLIADQHGPLTGTVVLNAEVASNTGWSRTIPLAPETAFAGPSARAEGTLRLDEVEAVIAAFEESTGANGRLYTLRIRPQVTVLGSVADQPVTDTFTPELAFQFDDVQMWIPDSAETLTHVEQDLAVMVPGITTGTMKVLGLDLPVPLGRIIALLAGLVGVVGLAVVALSGHPAPTVNGWRETGSRRVPFHAPSLDALPRLIHEMALPLIVFSVLTVTLLATLGMLLLISGGGPGS